MHYNKLVRDKIPEIIKNNGEKAITHIADDQEYRKSIKNKFFEEVEELFTETNTEDEIAWELADVLQLVYAVSDFKKISRSKLEEIRLKKLEERWGFKKRIILEETKEKTS